MNLSKAWPTGNVRAGNSFAQHLQGDCCCRSTYIKSPPRSGPELFCRHSAKPSSPLPLVMAPTSAVATEPSEASPSSPCAPPPRSVLADDATSLFATVSVAASSHRPRFEVGTAQSELVPPDTRSIPIGEAVASTMGGGGRCGGVCCCGGAF